jgi:hypothetical protein
VALVPIEFRPLRVAPYSARRLEFDQRFEQGAGYLDATTLGINGVVLGLPGFVSTPLIWSPGFSTFTALFTSTTFPGIGNLFVVLEHMDPETQLVAYGLITSPAVVIGDDTVQTFNFGSGGSFDFVSAPPQNSMVYLLWRLWIINVFEPGPITVSLELLANSRVTI